MSTADIEVLDPGICRHVNFDGKKYRKFFDLYAEIYGTTVLIESECSPYLQSTFLEFTYYIHRNVSNSAVDVSTFNHVQSSVSQFVHSVFFHVWYVVIIVMLLLFKEINGVVALDSIVKYSELTVDESLTAVLLVFQNNKSVTTLHITNDV